MIEGELFTVFSLVAVLAASNGRDAGSVCLTVDRRDDGSVCLTVDTLCL